MLGRKKTGGATPVTLQAEDRTPTRPPREGAKNRPTPKRRDAQAANLRPIVPADRKAALREDRRRQREQRNAERVALMQGDERNLPARDAGPHKRLIRDVVDARYNVGELYVPVMGVFLLGIVVPPFLHLDVRTRTMFSLWLSVLLYVLVALLLVDSFLMWRRARAALRARFGPDVSTRGLLGYAISRSVMVRRWRRPPAKVARGEFPTG